MALFHSRTEEKGKVFIKYNGLIVVMYYMAIALAVIVFLPLLGLFFGGGSENLAITLSNITDVILIPFMIFYFLYLIAYIVDSFGMWREVRAAMKKGGVIVKGSKFSFKDPISYEFNKDK